MHATLWHPRQVYLVWLFLKSFLLFLLPIFPSNLVFVNIVTQGIWLCEHRDHPTPRKVVVTLNGI